MVQTRLAKKPCDILHGKNPTTKERGKEGGRGKGRGERISGTP